MRFEFFSRPDFDLLTVGTSNASFFILCFVTEHAQIATAIGSYLHNIADSFTPGIFPRFHYCGQYISPRAFQLGYGLWSCVHNSLKGSDRLSAFRNAQYVPGRPYP